MSEFLTTLATTARIESIISRAEKHIVLVSPFLKWSALLFERLQEADRRDLPIVFIYGKSDLHTEQRALLERIDNLSLYFCRNLHAKCYFNEQELIISSLNLHEYSERNNREMSVIFRTDDRVYAAAVAEVQLIMEAADLEVGNHIILSEDTSRSKPRSDRRGSRRTRSTDEGFCIRCHDPISIDRANPHCNECHAEWQMWENREYEEQYCHGCGTEWPTCEMRPYCRECFRRSNSL